MSSKLQLKTVAMVAMVIAKLQKYGLVTIEFGMYGYHL